MVASLKSNDKLLQDVEAQNNQEETRMGEELVDSKNKISNLLLQNSNERIFGRDLLPATAAEGLSQRAVTISNLIVVIQST